MKEGAGSWYHKTRGWGPTPKALQLVFRLLTFDMNETPAFHRQDVFDRIVVADPTGCSSTVTSHTLDAPEGASVQASCP